MNTTSLDLNLLRVLETMMRLGSVSATALELNLSQPAISNALRRLREELEDELFIRTRRGMEPTAYAQAIAGPVSDGLRSIQAGLLRGAAFDPATAKRRFRLLMTDAGEVDVLPRLVPLLREKAPGVDLQVAQLPVERYFEALETGAVDLAIGNLRPSGGSLVVKRLVEDTYVALCREGHPWLARAPSLDEYLSAGHIAVLPPNSPGSAVDALAERERWSRRMVLIVPHFMVLAPIVEATDLVATVASRVAARLSLRHPVRAVPLPFVSPLLTISIGWHMRQQKDPGSRWLRETIPRLLEADPVVAEISLARSQPPEGKSRSR